MIVRVPLDDRIVGNLREATRDEAAEGMVIGVEVRTQEFGDEIRFLVRCGAEVFSCGIDARGRETVAFLHAIGSRGGAAIFGRKQGLLFRLEGLGEVFEKGFEGRVEGKVEEDDEDEEDNHEDDGARCGFDAEQADEADDGEVGAGGGLLQSARVDETLGVDAGVDDEQKIVAISEVDEVETNGRETEDKRRDDRIGDCCQRISQNQRCCKICLPMTVKLV